MKKLAKKHLVLNGDKKYIMDPSGLTFSGKSGLEDIAHVHPQMGNVFQYELYHLLMDEWKGDRFIIVEDSKRMREYLVKQEKYRYYRKYKQTLKRDVRTEQKNVKIISMDEAEIVRLKTNWDRFLNQYVLINYDSHLFMTIDRRLFKRTKNIMPYFVLAQAEPNGKSGGSWAGDRIGIEPIDTPTFDTLDYFEMFRMIGDKSACQLGVEDHERRYGHRK